MLNKKGMEFGWIFAVIVGAVILFLAFYFVGTHMIGERMKRETVGAQTLDVVVTPLMGMVADAESKPVKLPEKGLLLIGCESDAESALGWNNVSLILEKKEQVGFERIAYDKYIFADIQEEAKILQYLMIPMHMPWRVADLTMLWPADRQYCFFDAPSWIEDELGETTATSLNISSIAFGNKSKECPPETDIKVCFTQTNCDINVKGAAQPDSAGSVVKEGNTLFYAGDSLMLAAIFSEPELYKCNLQRLGKRLSMQTEIYEAKASGCVDLSNLNKTAVAISKGKFGELDTLKSAADAIASANRGCGLY